MHQRLDTDRRTGENHQRQRTIVQVLDSIGLQRGGLTKAVFERFRAISEDGHLPVLVTVAYQPNVRAVFEQLLSSQTVPRDTVLHSFHECLRVPRDNRQRIPRADHLWEADATVERVPETTNLTRYYRNGQFLGLVSRRSSGSLAYIDVHSKDHPWQLSYRDRMWDRETVGVREYLDESGNVRYKIYLDSDGHPYLSTWVTTAGYEYRTTLWRERPSAVLKDLRDANAIWLHGILANCSPGTVFADEPRTSFAFSRHTPTFQSIATIHTTHRTHTDIAGSVKQWFHSYRDSIDQIDALVSLTARQRDDLHRDLPGAYEALHVIPHPAPNLSDVRADRNLKHIVVVTRLAPEKRVDHIIRAFAASTAPRNGMQLHIYGTGPEMSTLQTIASDHGVSGTVFFHGYTNSPLGVFASGAFSLFASQFEGMGLVLLESISAGTPVVGYNVEYGPAEIISEPHGLPVPDGDIQQFAAAISKLAGSPSLLDEMRTKGWEFIEMYSHSNWVTRWRSLLTTDTQATAASDET